MASDTVVSVGCSVVVTSVVVVVVAATVVSSGVWDVVCASVVLSGTLVPIAIFPHAVDVSIAANKIPQMNRFIVLLPFNSYPDPILLVFFVRITDKLKEKAIKIHNRTSR